MLVKFNLIFLSLIFATVLEISVFQQHLFFWVLIFLIIFSALVVWPLARKIRFLAIPFFLSIGSLNLLILIDDPVEMQVFVALSTFVYYLSLVGAYRLKYYDCDQTAQGMVNFATLSTGFFWFVSNYGWYLNFQIGSWILVLTFIGSTFLIGLPSLMISQISYSKIRIRSERRLNGETTENNNKQLIDCFKQEKRTVIFFSSILSLIMGEVIWGLSLWPFAYLTTGVVALIIYFVLWDAVRMYILRKFSIKATIINIIFALLSIGGILSSAQWSLVV